MKQNLGLTDCQSPDARVCDHWYTLVALAMNMLLALRDALSIQSKPCYPQDETRTVSQRQAQRQALGIFLKLDPITRPCQPAGKGLGRAKGYRPSPRPRHSVKRKTKKQHKPCKVCPLQATI